MKTDKKNYTIKTVVRLLEQGELIAQVEKVNPSDDEFNKMIEDMKDIIFEKYPYVNGWRELASSTSGYHVLFNERLGLAVCCDIRLSEYVLDLKDSEGNPMCHDTFYLSKSDGRKYSFNLASEFFGGGCYIRYSYSSSGHIT